MLILVMVGYCHKEIYIDLPVHECCSISRQRDNRIQPLQTTQFDQLYVNQSFEEGRGGLVRRLIANVYSGIWTVCST